MLDVAGACEGWRAEGKRFAVALVTRTWGSSPRTAGSWMAVCEDGRIAGSVSGGCVESAVIERAGQAMASGELSILEFDSDEEDSAWNVGLSCGGRMRVLVEPAWASIPPESPSAWPEAIRRLQDGQPFVLSIRLAPGGHRHRVFDPAAFEGRPNGDPLERAAAEAFLRNESTEVDAQGAPHFLWVCKRPPRLVIVGGVHIAVPLLKFAKELGFETALVEPRATFASPDRFPVAPGQILCEWPKAALHRLQVDADTFAAVLTHDPKIDDQALRSLLKSPARYIGALGGASSHAKRLERLRAEGFNDDDLARIHGPIGLDIGAQTPEEIALSIMSQIVQVRRAGE